MKIVNPEILQTHHPKDWEVEQLHIGNSKNRIIKIKNWFKNPEQVRALALSGEYVCTVNGEFSNLPGNVSRIGHLSNQLYPNFKFLLSRQTINFPIDGVFCINERKLFCNFLKLP